MVVIIKIQTKIVRMEYEKQQYIGPMEMEKIT
jgi:hypothetical protein